MAKVEYVDKIKLASPIEWGEETITEIRIAKPRGKQFKKLPMEPKTMEDMFPFIASITDQPPAVLDDLEIEDLLQLMEKVEGFIPGGLEIGGKSGDS